MYTDFFGLRELPFELTPNPRFLFLTRGHREALTTLRHALSSAKGLALLVGEAGTGKTTLVRTVLDTQLTGVKALYLNNPTLTRAEFVEFLANGFGLSAEAARSKTTMLLELNRVLTFCRTNGEILALVVDEAQSLPHELLEEVRLLANIETTTEKLLPVVLVGQPELADRLNEPSLRQLKQRVALRCELVPMTLPETASYVAARVRIAGGDSTRLFTRGAIMLIHERSGGIPRTVSVMCDNALVNAFALDNRVVTRDIVLEVCRDFDLSGTNAPADALRSQISPGAMADELVKAPVLLERSLASFSGPPPPRKRRFSFF
jgi:general secretion pathway protein A